MTDTPLLKDEIQPEKTTFQYYENFLEGRYAIKFMGKRAGSRNDIYPSEWRPVALASRGDSSMLTEAMRDHMLRVSKNGGKKAKSLFVYGSIPERNIMRKFLAQYWMKEDMGFVVITSRNLNKILSDDWQNKHGNEVRVYIADGKLVFKDDKTSRRMASIIGLPSRSSMPNMETLAIAQKESVEETDARTRLLRSVGAERLFIRLMAHIKRKNGDIHMVVNMLDIDHFKVINEVFGHAQGDDVLRQFAEVLSHAVRANETDIVARLGGEEFGLIMPFDDETVDVEGILQERLKKSVMRFMKV